MIISKGLCHVTCLRKIIYFMLACGFSSAQSGEGVWGNWYTLGLTKKFNEKLSFSGIGEIRLFEVVSNYNFAFVQGTLNYNLGKFTASGGYLYGFLDTVYGEYESGMTENRLLQRISLKGVSYGKVMITHRYTLEERFFTLKTGSNTMMWRFRYQIKGIIALKETFYISLFNEFFIRSGDITFEQNHTSFALGLKPFKYFSLEMGYMRVHLLGRNLDRIQTSLLFSL